MSSKACINCMNVLPLSEFYAHRAMKDGHLNKCKECFKAAVRLNRILKIDYYRSFDRSRADLQHRVNARTQYQQTEAFRISHAAASKRWDVANAISRKAQAAVGNAIRDGKLAAQPCFVCGKKAEAHHPDYSAPLAVSWLCRSHHARAHAEFREYLRQMKVAA